MLSDAIFTSFYNYGMDISDLAEQLPTIIVLIFVFIIFMVVLHKNRKLLTFIIPYSIVGAFGSIVYASPHHIGVVTAFVIFTFLDNR